MTQLWSRTVDRHMPAAELAMPNFGRYSQDMRIE
jgi:hypothetical protein